MATPITVYLQWLPSARVDGTAKIPPGDFEVGVGDVISADVTKVMAEREKEKDSGEDEEKEEPTDKGTRILRVPGMSLDQASKYGISTLTPGGTTNVF